MKKSNLVFLIMLAFLSNTAALFAAETSTKDDERIFSQRLNDFFEAINLSEARLSNPSSKGLTPQEQEYRITQLVKFGEDYPNSRFSDDATYVSAQILFAAKLGPNPLAAEPSPEKIINRVDLLAQIPGAELEEVTVQKIQGSVRLSYLAAFSYAQAVDYMKGQVAFDRQDFSTVINVYSRLKDELDYGRDPTRQLETLIYLPLYVSMAKSGKGSEAEAVLREAVSRFPENGKFKRLLDKHFGAPNNS